MTQLVLNIDDSAILPHLKKILNAIEGVSIAKTTRKKLTGMEKAMDDVKNGRITSYSSKEELYKDLSI